MNKYLLCLLLLCSCISCKKQDDWLNVKSNKSDVVPATLANYQALLDNDNIMNAAYPALGITGADNYYIDFSFWQSLFTVQERNSYTWAADIFETEPSYDWNSAYRMVAYANIVLGGIGAIAGSPADMAGRDNITGSALFYRASAFFNLAQLFAKPYDGATAATDPGIPLRLAAEVNKTSVRASAADTYGQVISDLHGAAALLPLVARYQTRPSKMAARALLARVYLSMGEYDSALIYADQALSDRDTLVDYNTLDAGATDPFAPFPNNPEILYYAVSNSFYIFSPYDLKADSLLYRSYAADDLRKVLFYTEDAGGALYKGDYTGQLNYALFAGLATNELYLIKAECTARMGNTAGALSALNTLLVNRFRKGAFTPVKARDTEEALDIIVAERRKELPFTADLRWQDLRRLNKDPHYAITLTRLLNGQTYTLPPNDNRYVYPIPPDEIKLSGLEQNPR